MQKNDLIHTQKAWEGKIDDVHVIINLMHKIREPRTTSYNTIRGQTLTVTSAYPEYYKRSYFQIRTPHDTYQLPASVKSLKQAKHWVRHSLDNNTVIQKKQWTDKKNN